MLRLLIVLVAVRLVLAIVLEPLAERVLTRVLGTRVDVGNVSFAPIDAVVTLRNVVVHGADEEAKSAGGEPAITADRVRLDVQWLPLLHRSLLLRQLTLESARIDLERLRGDGSTLERVWRFDPTTELPEGWSFALDRIALRDSQVRLRDGEGGASGALDVAVHDARVSTRRRRATVFGRAPNLHVDAVVDGGRLLIAGSSDVRDDGVAIDAIVHVKDVPLERLAAYRPALVGSSVAGQMSGRLKYQREPGRRDRLTGRLRGRRIAVHVPALAGPALAIRRAEVAVDGIDLQQRRVAIGTLTLHGARLAMRPDLVAPVPLLDGLIVAPDAPVDSRRAPAAAPRAATWTWTIGHLAAPFARLIVAGAGEERSLAASVSGDSIGPGSYWSPLRAWIGWDGGTATFDGTARMARGFVLEGRFTASEVDAVAVAHAVGPPLAALVQAGRGTADLTVELALGATGLPLDARGRISVGDLWLAGPDPETFAFGARAVDLELEKIIPAKGSAARTAPVEIRFASAAVTSPYVKILRTPTGWSADTTRPADGAPATAASAVAFVIGNVRARDGRLLVADQVAAPTLALDLAAVDGWARELRLPAVGLGNFEIGGTDRRLGGLRLAGGRSGGELRAELSAPHVSLAAATPYLQRAGLPWAFTSGTGTIRSRLSIAGERWSADTTLTLREPTLGGDEEPLERSLGMAPAAAFAALRERHGEVSLHVPLGSPGWAGGRPLSETVASAMREALARPRLASLPEGPLQVGFAPGRAEPTPHAARQLAAIAEILLARPDVVVELRGAISREDRRWLAEQAVTIDDTDEPGGFRGLLRAIGVRDQRGRIRDALAARGAGRPGRLDAADEATLGTLVAAAPPVDDERLANLATARSALVANLLADRHGVTAGRVVAAGPTADESPAPPAVDARFLPATEGARW